MDFIAKVMIYFCNSKFFRYYCVIICRLLPHSPYLLPFLQACKSYNKPIKTQLNYH